MCASIYVANAWCCFKWILLKSPLGNLISAPEEHWYVQSAQIPPLKAPYKDFAADLMKEGLKKGDNKSCFFHLQIEPCREGTYHGMVIFCLCPCQFPTLQMTIRQIHFASGTPFLRFIAEEQIPPWPALIALYEEGSLGTFSVVFGAGTRYV